MLLGPWLSPLFGAMLYSSPLALADEAAAQPGSPSYQGKDPCPAHCDVAGPVSSNWFVYHNLDQLQRCPQQLFLDFSIYDQIDDPTVLHRLRACTMWGVDWENVPAILNTTPATTVNATYQLGWWNADSTVTGTVGDAHSLAWQMQTYFANGHGPTNRTAIVFGLSGNATLGVYLGKALQNEGMGEVALKNFATTISTIGVSGGLAMQLCGSSRDADYVFGVIATVNGTFAAVQSAMQLWSKAECLDGFSETSNITGPVFVTAPPLFPISNSTNLNELLGFNNTNSTTTTAKAARSLGIARRGSCTTIQVVSGDSCSSLASKCKISGNTFISYNPQTNLCSTLQPGQHVCCSAGTLPNFQPQPNSDGSCATYTTVAGDSCYAIAAAYSLTTGDLESFNKNTWGWNGCSDLWVGVNMCLSTGTPPMPAPVANAVCGPQVPGTVKPPAGTDLSNLNPCLLNACCDVWGQCGTTVEFCTNTSTGAPGTAQAGTNGCISNCGTNIVQSGPPATYINVGYFEGFNLGRPCLNMDIRQLNTTTYTNIHFAFATLTSNYEVVIGDGSANFEFQEFVSLSGPKRILSFGGWDFSTDPSTYMIFRDGVTAANRLSMATNIANFIIANNLDGVDIDWEYPGVS
jgi:LysM repeat protein